MIDNRSGKEFVTMGIKALKGLVFALSVVLFAGYVQGAMPGYGAMGDSLTDEYQFSDNGNHSAARNWLEQLAVHRGLDFGAFSSSSRGEPRLEGYEFNWARYGATTSEMISGGQNTGIEAQVEGEQVKLVCLMIGNNDFARNYIAIYNGEDWSSLVDSAMNNVRLVVGHLVDRVIPVKIVVATIPDWELDPWYRVTYPDANKRQRVRDAIAEYNRQIKTVFATWSRVVIADVYQLSLNILASNTLTVGGYEVDLNSWGDTPDKVILGDHIHPGTIAQGLIANEFIKAMNLAGESITLFSDSEILNNAGIYTLDAGVTGAHGQVSPTKKFDYQNAIVPLTATPENGYKVKKWTGTDNDVSTANNNTVTLSSDKTVTVEFEIIPVQTFQLNTGVAGGNGTLAPPSGKYDPGTVVTLTATPAVNYRVKKWTGTDNDASTANTNTVTMSSDKTVTVEFELIPEMGVQLNTGVAGGNGSVFPNSAKYEKGKVIQLTAFPAAGWRVKVWTGTDNDASTANVNTVTMSSDKTVTVEFEQYLFPVTTDGFGAIGDSLTDEYEFADGGGHSAGRNWLEQLAVSRLLNFGNFSPWSRGVPRYEGYEFNWARAGATIEALLSEGQPEGVAAQVVEGKVKLVCVMVGNSDFAFNYGTIYNTGESTALVNDMITRLHTAVDMVLNASPQVKVVLATIPDWEINPWFRENFPDVAKRQRVRSAMAEYNRRIKEEFASGARVVFADIYQLSLKILADNQLKVGGYDIDLNNWGNTPDKLILADHIHPGTIAQGLVANEFLKAINQAGENIPPLTDLEILNNAGVYTLQASVTAGYGKVSPAEGSYTQGTVVTLTAAPEKGYRVKAWLGTNNDGSTGLTNQVTINGNQVVSVAFEVIPGMQYQLTTGVVSGHGTIAPSAGQYDPGTMVTLTATPDPGYRVKQWIGTDNDAGTLNTNTVTMNSDKTVTVEFEETTATKYLLTTTVIDGNGTLAPSSAKFALGTVVTLTANPDPGYRVKQWTGTDNDASTSNTNTVTMDADKLVTVKFEEIPSTGFQLLARVGIGSGTVTPQSGIYSSGTLVTLIATPALGCQVKKWTGTDNDASTSTLNTVTMNANKTVTVDFEQIPKTKFQLNVGVIGGHGTLTPPSNKYEVGREVALIATPEAAYRVKKWTGTANDSLRTNTNTVVVDSDKTVTVEFEKYQYQLTVTIIGGHGSIWPLGGYYNADLPVALQVTPNSGYRVKQWTGTDDDNSTQLTNQVTMDSDRTVTVEIEAVVPSSQEIVDTPTPTPTPGSGGIPFTGCVGSGALIILVIFLAGMLLEFNRKE